MFFFSDARSYLIVPHQKKVLFALVHRLGLDTPDFSKLLSPPNCKCGCLPGCVTTSLFKCHFSPLNFPHLPPAFGGGVDGKNFFFQVPLWGTGLQTARVFPRCKSANDEVSG